MQKLIQGIHHFQNHVFRSKKELFNRLAGGQAPAALFLTCSDSRINPNLVTQTEPGEIFVVRNAGNIIPAAPVHGGEIATIEFAVKALGIQDIIVCGHSDCGAVKGLLNPCAVEESMPGVARWLQHARRTVDIMESEYAHLEGHARLITTIEENVVVQIENLRTHDFIEQRLASGDLKLHGWMYKFETGQIFTYEAESGQFLAMQDQDSVRPVYPRDFGLNNRSLTDSSR
jgi:carbonic anhydrase